MSSTCDVSKVDKSNKEMELSENIQDISVACEVLKLVKFNEANLKHWLNIEEKSLIWEVLKLDIFNESKNWQLSNMQDIDITCEVSKLDKSNEYNDEQ